jgi:anionic cell wall polymer biosynthesis LytR-Cps2A-Psr (LCP) family protein
MIDVGLGNVVGRVALGLAIVVLSAVGIAVAWGLWQYEQFAGAAGQAQARLPSVIGSSLAKAGGTAESPQVILVRGYGGVATGSMLLVRSDPARDEMAYLTVPRRVSGAPRSTDHPDGAAISRLIHDLHRSAGIGVQHVALLDFSAVSEIVDDLGGITVANPAPFDVALNGARSVHFPVGQVALNGARTTEYLSVKPTTKSERALREANEQRVLQSVVNSLIRPSNITDLTSTSAAVANDMETDLTTSDIIGLVSARIHATQVVNCSLSRARSFAQPDSRSALAVFLAEGTTSRFCSAKSLTPIASASILQAGAEAVSRYGAYAFIITLAVLILVVTAGLWLLLRRPSPTGDKATPGAVARSLNRLANVSNLWHRRRSRLGTPGLAVRSYDRLADAWDLWRWRRRPRRSIRDAMFDRFDRLRFTLRRGSSR